MFVYHCSCGLSLLSLKFPNNRHITSQFEQAITLCAENNVPLTEDMVESLTPAKNSVDSVTRTRILEKIAECCYQQEIYHLATKKYTQAGNKLQVTFWVCCIKFSV